MQTFWAGIFPILICRRPFSVIQSIQLWCQNNKFKASNQSTEKLDYFSGIRILCGLEQCVELANEKLFSSGQVVAGGDPQSQVGVLKNRRDVLNERFFINTNRQNLVRQKKIKSNQISLNAQGPCLWFIQRSYLPFTIDTNDAGSRLMWSSYEDGFSWNAIHVNARSSFHIVQMDITIFGYQIKHIVLGTNLIVIKEIWW